VSRSYALAFGTLALIGLFDAVVNVTRQNVVQLASPGRLRGA